ncbi:MAG: flippase-like domain-containing protein [Lentisphaerae bacterium]|nr:flippase-like domain-containing protein [Lentisphaerota bacterium]
MTARRIRLRSYASRAVGLLLLAWILARSDITAIAQQIRSVHVSLYLFTFLLFLPQLWLKAIRWRRLVTERGGATMTRGQALASYASAIFLGACTPGRLGELSRISYARNAGAGPGRAVAATIADRLLDLGMLVFLGYGAAVIHFGFTSRHALIVLALLAGGVTAAVLAVILRHRLLSVVRRVAGRILSDTRAERLDAELLEFSEALARTPWRTWAFCLLLTLLAWSAYYVQRYAIAAAAGVNADFMYVTAVVSVVGLLGVLPVSVLNIGTRDAALLLLLADIGVPAEQAVGFSSLILLAMLANTAFSSIFFLARRRH